MSKFIVVTTSSVEDMPGLNITNVGIFDNFKAVKKAVKAHFKKVWKEYRFEVEYWSGETTFVAYNNTTEVIYEVIPIPE